MPLLIGRSGSQAFQVFFCGNFYIHAHAVGIKPRFVYQFPAGSGNALQMNVSVETMHGTQVFGNTHQTLHRIIGIAHHSAAHEKPLDVVTPIELHGQLHQLADRKGGTRNVVRPAVDTIGTIVDTIVGQHDFQ